MPKETKNKDKAQLTQKERWELACNNIKTEIKKIDKRQEKLYFFVMDTKGSANGELMYIYHTAKMLKDLGYDVRMLHADEDFIGVAGWLGDEYAKLPHYNIETDGVNVSPSDFLFIPELYSNVMFRTMKLPCKRAIILTNQGYMTEVIEPGRKWTDYGITDCIVSTETLKKKVNSLFPKVNTLLVQDFISDVFNCKTKLKKPFINIISKDNSDTNRIVKEFFWRYPTYQWLPFRELRNLDQEQLSEALDEAFLTIWVDRTTGFGYSALQAMKTGSLVMGMLPENELEWDNQTTHDCGVVWVERIDDIFKLIIGITDTYLDSDMPTDFINDAKEIANGYSEEKFRKTVLDTYVHKLIDDRKKELENALKVATENATKEK